jgi:uncharacterized protein YceK
MPNSTCHWPTNHRCSRPLQCLLWRGYILPACFSVVCASCVASRPTLQTLLMAGSSSNECIGCASISKHCQHSGLVPSPSGHYSLSTSMHPCCKVGQAAGYDLASMLLKTVLLPYVVFDQCFGPCMLWRDAMACAHGSCMGHTDATDWHEMSEMAWEEHRGWVDRVCMSCMPAVQQFWNVATS